MKDTFLEKKLKNVCGFKNNAYLCIRNRERKHSNNGVVVQLVRIPACHAGGRGFESRPYRRSPEVLLQDFFVSNKQNVAFFYTISHPKIKKLRSKRIIYGFCLWISK